MRAREVPRYKENLVRLFKNMGAVKLGNHKFCSGKIYPFKIDAEEVLNCFDGCYYAGEIGRKIIRDIRKKTKRKYEIAGVSTGGSMFANAVTDGDPYLDVDHKEGTIRGNVEELPYIICEDVTSTGESIIQCRDLMEKRDIEADHALIIVVNFMEAIDNLKSQGLEPHYILTKEDLGVKY